MRRDRRDKRGGGAIADTTIRCGCDEAISASYVVAAEVRQAADAQASSALPRAAARQEATDDQHGPVRSGVARKQFDFMSQGATPSTRRRRVREHSNLRASTPPPRDGWRHTDAIDATPRPARDSNDNAGAAGPEPKNENKLYYRR